WEVRLGDSEKWLTIDVPSSIDYEGILHFRKTFTLPEDIGRYHLRLAALGINYRCSITLNDIFIGTHSAGYSKFSFDLFESSLLPGRENVLEIDVDGRRASNSPALPRSQPWGWKSYAGIIREIYIQVFAKTTITQWSLSYDFSEDYRNSNTTFKFLFQNFSQASDVTQRETEQRLRNENIQEIGYYVDIYNTKTGTLAKSTAANPKFISVHRSIEDTIQMTFRDVDLWYPDDPVQYIMTVTLIRRGNIIIDRFRAQFGFRYLEYRPDGLYLNGSLIKINGIYRIEQHPEYGASLPWNVQKDDLILIKNLGLNSVRSGPYPNHPYFYDLCDEMGILVLEEIPVSNIPAPLINDPEYIEQSRLFLEQLIERDRYHPSIIGWGLGSGLDVSHRNTAEFIETLAVTARQHDDRPVYYSTELTSNDLCFQYVDFKLLDTFSPAISSLTRFFNEEYDTALNKPVFIGRIGTDIFPGNVEGYRNPTSLSHQAKYISDIFQFTRSNDNVPGIFFWSFADWKGGTPALAAHYNDIVYYRGLVTEERIERPAYIYLKSTIGNSHTTPLSMGSEPAESQRSIIITGLIILLFLVVYQKQNKWFSQNYRRSLMSAKIFFEDVVDRRNINATQTVILGLVICSSVAIGITCLSFYLKRSVYFDLMISQFVVNPLLKQFTVYAIWHPVFNIFITTLLFMALLVTISFLYGFILSFIGMKRTFSFSCNILIWSGSHMVFLIPFSIALFSLLFQKTSTYIYIIPGFFFFAVYCYRLTLALRVSTRYNFKKALIGLFLLLLLFWGGIALYYESTYQTFTYLNHYLTIVQSNLQ
ncbi:glycoside hydrolase family 2 protein, partial [candidate division KSB1 bacterium]